MRFRRPVPGRRSVSTRKEGVDGVDDDDAVDAGLVGRDGGFCATSTFIARGAGAAALSWVGQGRFFLRLFLMRRLKTSGTKRMQDGPERLTFMVVARVVATLRAAKNRLQRLRGGHFH